MKEVIYGILFEIDNAIKGRLINFRVGKVRYTILFYNTTASRIKTKYYFKNNGVIKPIMIENGKTNKLSL